MGTVFTTFFHMVSGFLLIISLFSQALTSAALRRRLLHVMVYEFPFPELTNASLHLLAAVVCIFWSHKSKLGGCIKEP